MLAGLVTARFVHYGATTFLFGALLFPTYAFRADDAKPVPAALDAALRWPVRWAAGLAIVSGLAWFAFSVAEMAGDPAATTNGGLLLSTAWDMDFGRLWIVRISLAAVLFLLRAPRRSAPLRPACIALSAALLGSLAWTGHARAEAGWREWVHVGADAMHLLTAGLWIGALPLIVLMFGRSGVKGDDRGFAHRALRRFSVLASIAVAILIATGFVNTALLIASPIDLVRSPWGWVLLGKLALVTAMLGLAATNRRRWTPALAASSEAEGRRAAGELQRNVRLEALLAGGVLLAVSFLGVLAPP
jgi:putative copper resistance protein D